jgi:hypothetical protein
MALVRDAVRLWAMSAFLLAPLIASDCFADCIACWELKGTIIHMKDGSKIEGYATWNEAWVESELRGKKQFPEVIFDPSANLMITDIEVYTHIRSIKYPDDKALVTTRRPIRVEINEIKDVKLNPGPHDGYGGAGDLPVVSPRIADLLQTKPVASCEYGEGLADVYLLSYDKSFPSEELQRLCEQGISDEQVKNLEARDIIRLVYPFD